MQKTRNNTERILLVGPAHIEKERRAKLAQRKGLRRNHSAAPDKRNIVEIQRLLNRKNLKSKKQHQHVKKLHQLNHKRKEAREVLKETRKVEKETEETNYPFKPAMNKTSKYVMANREESMLQRNEEWNTQKHEKIKLTKEEREQVQLQKEEEARRKEDFKKKNFYVDSKVKRIIETTMDVGRVRRRSGSFKYKNRSHSPYMKR